MGSHYPVLLNEAINALQIKEDGIYVDCTLGRAGHSSLILSKAKKGHLYSFDLDEVAMKESKAKLEEVGDNFTLIRSNFAEIKARLSGLGVSQVDGILADLGVSSPQFDEASRGFSYKEEARLDMRMDQSQSLSAYEVVNSYSEKELERIFFEYGEDPDSRRIARNIVREREKKPIETTFDLVSIIKSSKSEKELRKKGHPAKQIFQAIRMEVNGEEEALKALLRDGPGLLKSGGRLAIITFMSTDDRLVKKAFQELSLPKVDRHEISLPGEQKMPYLLPIKKPILPSEKELSENRRSLPAKLRVLEKR